MAWMPSRRLVTAAHLRFRPIVMTSLAFMLGLVPLIIASGPGSAARRDIGTGVFFGMAVAITVGIVFVPFFLRGCRPHLRAVAPQVVNQNNPDPEMIKHLIAAAALLIALLRHGLLRHQKPPARPAPTCPAHFVEGFDTGLEQDTLSIADLKWWEFYADSTLASIMRIALDNNRDLLKAAAKVEQMRALYGVSKADLLPKVGLDMAYSYETNKYDGGPTSKDPEHDPEAPPSHGEVNLWGSLFHAKKNAGKARFMASVEDYRAMRMTLIAEVATAYFKAPLARERARHRQADPPDPRGGPSIRPRIRFEGGVTSETVYQQAVVEYSSTASLIPGLELRGHGHAQFAHHPHGPVSPRRSRNPATMCFYRHHQPPARRHPLRPAQAPSRPPRSRAAPSGCHGPMWA